jgi:predicted GH43/DUF377 family glycosyl hydrolase
MGIYKMWYTGHRGPGGIPFAIGYATSSDGVNWNRVGTSPVLDVGPAGAWDAGQVRAPSVIKDGAVYRMWYLTDTQVGYATSSDGITWAKYPNNPVLTPGPADWDSVQIVFDSVILDAGGFKMWYVGCGGAGATFRCQIGYATSPDGSTWTKFNGGSEPVLTTGPSGAWDGDSLSGGGLSVLKVGSTYLMWYSGRGGFVQLPQGVAGISSIGFASSSDGISWTKSLGNPILSPVSDSWESVSVYTSVVLLVGPSLRMWYSGEMPSEQPGLVVISAVGLAE